MFICMGQVLFRVSAFCQVVQKHLGFNPLPGSQAPDTPYTPPLVVVVNLLVEDAALQSVT